ncbi:permease [Acuticoccus sp. M5D2P5]|uniref:permease n=1 Tax=Acuticoccus kalidii TaxID=2910977 RepID=UPI001F26D104|nr:permease [Acuticoccus kalidii]MCF3934516.1 permease [Acuticoccus kalidii]
MDLGIALLLLIAAGLGGTLAVRDPARLKEGLALAWKQGQPLLVRIPVAILAATYLSRLVPQERVSQLLGPDSGFVGILIASAVGGLTPGGPMLAFPLALVIWQLGAGEAQMVAFLASWSILAIHRVLTYEIPLLGGRFTMIRIASSWMLPPLAGVLAAGMLLFWHGTLGR